MEGSFTNPTVEKLSHNLSKQSNLSGNISKRSCSYKSEIADSVIYITKHKT